MRNGKSREIHVARWLTRKHEEVRGRLRGRGTRWQVRQHHCSGKRCAEPGLIKDKVQSCPMHLMRAQTTSLLMNVTHLRSARTVRIFPMFKIWFRIRTSIPQRIYVLRYIREQWKLSCFTDQRWARYDGREEMRAPDDVNNIIIQSVGFTKSY